MTIDEPIADCSRPSLANVPLITAKRQLIPLPLPVATLAFLHPILPSEVEEDVQNTLPEGAPIVW
jgi:hypothetical protein